MLLQCINVRSCTPRRIVSQGALHGSNDLKNVAGSEWMWIIRDRDCRRSLGFPETFVSQWTVTVRFVVFIVTYHASTVKLVLQLIQSLKLVHAVGRINITAYFTSSQIPNSFTDTYTSYNYDFYLISQNKTHVTILCNL